jgi:hypothetical protein
MEQQMIEDAIVQRLPLNQNNFILLYDPDDMVAGEKIVSRISSCGYTLINYEDSDMFRFYFEQILNKGTDIDEAGGDKIILRLTRNTYVPYDIQSIFQEIRITIKDIFPGLSYTVLKEMGSGILNDVYDAYKNYTGLNLGDGETLDFVLENVYGIFPDTIHTYEDLIKTLIKIYYCGKELPEIILNYLSKRFETHPDFINFPVKKILSGKQSFFYYLQLQWELYIKSFFENNIRSDVNFGHADIRVYMDNLFSEGYLTPVYCHEIQRIPVWARDGVIYQEFLDKKKNYEELMEKVRTSLEKVESFKDWWGIASRWAELLVIVSDSHMKKELDIKEFEKTSLHLERCFKEWLLENYGLLSSLSYTAFPVMVHHIPWHIHYRMQKENFKKAALIVFDGMSMDNWMIIKRHLAQSKTWILEENLSFAWIPTMTYISRQAIFSGQVPAYFADTFFSTDNDENHWKRFWMDRGFRADAIYYMRNIKHFDENGLEELVKNPKARILGLVVNMIDDMVHGGQLLLSGMHQDIKLWLKEGGLERFLLKLSASGYEIYITSDHGNVSAVGQGRLQEGLGVDQAESRVRIYEKSKSHENAVQTFRAFKWKAYGLPPDYNYIICDDNFAYGKYNEKIICHGGTSIEEVIVPFVHVRKGA